MKILAIIAIILLLSTSFVYAGGIKHTLKTVTVPLKESVSINEIKSKPIEKPIKVVARTRVDIPGAKANVTIDRAGRIKIEHKNVNIEITSPVVVSSGLLNISQNDFDESIEIAKTNITKIRIKTKKIMKRIRARVVRFKPKFLNATILYNNGTVQLVRGNATINISTEVEIENGTMYIRTRKIRKRLIVLPEQASEIAKVRVNYFVIKTLSIGEEDGEPVYTLVDIENSKVRAIKRPWWSFLVF